MRATSVRSFRPLPPAVAAVSATIGTGPCTLAAGAVQAHCKDETCRLYTTHTCCSRRMGCAIKTMTTGGGVAAIGADGGFNMASAPPAPCVVQDRERRSQPLGRVPPPGRCRSRRHLPTSRPSPSLAERGEKFTEVAVEVENGPSPAGPTVGQNQRNSQE